MDRITPGTDKQASLEDQSQKCLCVKKSFDNFRADDRTEIVRMEVYDLVTYLVGGPYSYLGSKFLVRRRPRVLSKARAEGSENRSQNTTQVSERKTAALVSRNTKSALRKTADEGTFKVPVGSPRRLAPHKTVRFALPALPKEKEARYGLPKEEEEKYDLTPEMKANLCAFITEVRENASPAMQRLIDLHFKE